LIGKQLRRQRRFINKIIASSRSKDDHIKESLKNINSEIRTTKNQIEKLAQAIFEDLNKEIFIPKLKELSQRLKKLDEKKK